MNKIINKRFSELTVLEIIKKPNTEKYKSWNTPHWVKCRCSCGKVIDVPLYGLLNKKIKSCGHLKKEKAIKKLNNFRKKHPEPTNAINITYKEKTMNLKKWAEETGIPRTTIMYRYNKGMPPEKILEKESE